MVVIVLRSWIVLLLLVPFGAWANGNPSRLIYCLEAAEKVEKSAFKSRHKYVMEEYRLRASLSTGCASLRYEIWHTAGGGFRILSQLYEETWSIDNTDNLVRLTGIPGDSGGGGGPTAGGGPGSGGSSYGGSGSGPPGGSAGAYNRNITVNHEPLGDKRDATGAPPGYEMGPPRLGRAPGGTATPVVEEEESGADTVVAGGSSAPDYPPPSYADTGPPPAPAPSVPDDPMRVQLCLSKQLSETAACKKILADVDKTCSNVDPSSPNLMCASYRNYASSGGGRMAVAARPSDSKLKPWLANDRSLRNPAQTDLDRVIVPGSGSGSGPPADRSLLRYIENVNNLSAALQGVLTLRPVTFQWKEDKQRALGFVAEEVNLLDQRLAIHNDKGGVEGVNYGQLTALLTGGIQELYGMCHGNIELQKNMITRITILENQNEALKAEMNVLKAKMGVK